MSIHVGFDLTLNKPKIRNLNIQIHWKGNLYYIKFEITVINLNIQTLLLLFILIIASDKTHFSNNKY